MPIFQKLINGPPFYLDSKSSGASDASGASYAIDDSDTSSASDASKLMMQVQMPVHKIFQDIVLNRLSFQFSEILKKTVVLFVKNEAEN